MTLTGFYNAVPTTVTMLFHLGKKSSFSSSYPFGQSMSFLAIGGMASIFPSTRFRVSATVARYVRLGYAQDSFGSMIMRFGPRGDKKQRMGTARTSCPVDSPAPLFVAPSALQAADCQIPGLLDLRPYQHFMMSHCVAVSESR